MHTEKQVILQKMFRSIELPTIHSEQREIARSDKDDIRQHTLQITQEKKNSNTIAQVVPKDMDDEREM